ncbi:MAG: adenine nucleotide alpha hydrolase family protein [Anaerolineales bacterium]|nr:adenine nucleotide alpha hydrolase family protein [Anaerolineales bacterium]
MKCRRCGGKAVINMRQHKLALCKDDYLAWVPEQVERAIHKYRMFTRQERILAAVSGGKDSLSLWDILHRLGYAVDGLYIGLGIDGGISYSAESQRLSEQFAEQHGLKLHVVNVPEEYGASIPEIASRTQRGRYKPCSICGLSKRHIMNRVARQGGYDVLVTGHNLDDEAAVLFGNTLHWAGSYLLRQAPVLEADAPGLVRKVKPLCRMYEREMAAYALLAEIAYIYDECPYAQGATSIYYKEILNRMESDNPGAKLSFYLSFLQAKKAGLFSEQVDQQRAELHTCPSCGQPTTAPGMCAFCRMVERQ